MIHNPGCFQLFPGKRLLSYRAVEFERESFKMDVLDGRELTGLVATKIDRHGFFSWAKACQNAGLPAIPPDKVVADDYLSKLWLSKVDGADDSVMVMENIEDRDKHVFVPVKMRGTHRYAYDMRCKLRRLGLWIQNSDQSAIMLTMTLQPSRFEGVVDAFEKMAAERNVLLRRIELNLKRKFDFLWVVEPHDSGYPHLHLIVFAGWIPHIEELAKWWENRGMGLANGFDWSRPVRGARARKKVVQYITKYATKALRRDDDDVPVEGDNAPVKKGLWGGLLWSSGKRSYGCSRPVSGVLNNEKPPGADVGLVDSLRNSTRLAHVNEIKWEMLGICLRGEAVDCDDFHGFFNWSPPPPAWSAYVVGRGHGGVQSGIGNLPV